MNVGGRRRPNGRASMPNGRPMGLPGILLQTPPVSVGQCRI